eukprot:1155337-Pelagomonas_calceolata.AAC.1
MNAKGWEGLFFEGEPLQLVRTASTACGGSREGVHAIKGFWPTAQALFFSSVRLTLGLASSSGNPYQTI